MTAITASAFVVVDAPRQRVWEALTDPELVSQYFMGAQGATDWQVGHPITFTVTWKDKPFKDKGAVFVAHQNAKTRIQQVKDPVPGDRRVWSMPHGRVPRFASPAVISNRPSKRLRVRPSTWL